MKGSSEGLFFLRPNKTGRQNGKRSSYRIGEGIVNVEETPNTPQALNALDDKAI